MDGRRTLIALVALCLLGGLARPAAAQSASDLFDDRTVQELHLLVNSRDLVEFRTRYLENFWVPADLVWRGVRIRNVGMRVRGTGSRNPDKMGLLLDFDYYTKGQQFVGFSSLVLDNLWQDASQMREALAMTIYRRLGQPAPREAFAKVFVNNQYQGLYTIVEPIDPAFVARALGDGSGYLFEFRWAHEFYSEYLGDDLKLYAEFFEPRSHESESDTAFFGPIRDLFFEINTPDDSVWRTRVEERIDLGQFMTQVAIQGFLAQNDGILGYAGMNNFYLYRFPGSSKHRLFPWDEDFAFTFLDASVYRRGNQPFILFERALAEPDLRDVFVDVVARCAQLAFEGGWLSAEVERVAALITPAVLEDSRKQYPERRFSGSTGLPQGFCRDTKRNRLARDRATARSTNGVGGRRVATFGDPENPAEPGEPLRRCGDESVRRYGRGATRNTAAGGLSWRT